MASLLVHRAVRALILPIGSLLRQLPGGLDEKSAAICSGPTDECLATGNAEVECSKRVPNFIQAIAEMPVG